MEIHSEIQRAARRTQSNKALIERRRVQMNVRLHAIVLAGPCTAPGPRYVLAQNAGNRERPLWIHLCLVPEEPRQLVFCGNRRPLEISEADAIELAPALELFVGEVVFQLHPGIAPLAAGALAPGASAQACA